MSEFYYFKISYNFFQNDFVLTANLSKWFLWLEEYINKNI